MVLLTEMVITNISDLMGSMDVYEANFTYSLAELNSLSGMDLASSIIGYMNEFDLSNFANELLGAGTSFLGNAFLVPIYVLFLLIEENIFHLKLKALVKSPKKQSNITKLFQKMDKNISRYMLLKTLVSLLTGVLSYLVLLAIGIDAPVFWAMLIFVLNYIPTIGSLIATLFPALFAVFQYGHLGPFMWVLASVGAIQIIVGNIFEPKIMGNSLNISSLVVVLSLALWGAIWGIMGMILSVPITVMMIVAFVEIPQLRFIAVLLSEKGELNPMEE